MEKPSTNRLPGRTVSLSKGRNGRISQFRKQGPPQEGIAINQVRKLGCSNEGHKVKPSPVKSHHCQTVRTHSLIGTTGHDFCRRKPKVPGRGGKTCGWCSGKEKKHLQEVAKISSSKILRFLEQEPQKCRKIFFRKSRHRTYHPEKMMADQELNSRDGRNALRCPDNFIIPYPSPCGLLSQHRADKGQY